MFYFETKLHAIVIFTLYSFIFPLRYCNKVKATDILDDINRLSFYTTRQPVPWSQSTVSKLLTSATNGENSDLQSFKIFVYVLLSIGLVVALYYCQKCCRCFRACTIIINGSPQSLRRAQSSSSRNTRFISIDRTSRSRIARRIRADRRYERMQPQLHSSRSGRTSHGHLSHSNSGLKDLQSLDKPPDYSSVIEGNLGGEQERYPGVSSQNLVESPPPGYHESLF